MNALFLRNSSSHENLTPCRKVLALHALSRYNKMAPRFGDIFEATTFENMHIVGKVNGKKTSFAIFLLDSIQYIILQYVLNHKINFDIVENCINFS